MIAIGKLTELINKGLNALAAANGFPFVFAIKSEGGEYMPPLRKGNNVTIYINGETRVVNSEIIPTQGIKVATQTVELTLAYPLPDDIPVEDAIAPMRSVLDAYFQNTSLQSLDDDSGKSFTVASYSSIPTIGEIAMNTGPGLMCPFVCEIFYSFIQNGINSSNFVISFNGIQVPYMDATITRVPVMNSTPYSNTGGSAESVTEATALNIEFSAPTLGAEGNALFTAFKNFLLTGQHDVYPVTVMYENKPTTYRMTFGQTALSLEGIKNGNSRITLVEAREFE